MSQYDRQFFEYFNWIKRSLENRSLLLGGYTASGGGGGGPPGGFVGMLPQTRVACDLTEAANSGWVSGVTNSGNLVDNLNHIRYRLGQLESGVAGGYPFEKDDIIITPNVTVVNFEGDVDVVDEGSGKVTISISGIKTFTGLEDTPDSYTGNAGRLASVKGDESGLEFITASGVVDSLKTKVTNLDTTEDFLASKIIPGSGIAITTISGGANEHLEVSLSRQVRIMGIGDAGVLTSGNLGLRLHAPYSGEITNVTVAVTEAPTGTDLILDVYKNGSTIFTASGNKPTILDGETEDLTNVPDTIYFVENDVFTFHVLQIGSLNPGSGLVMQIRSLV